MAFIQSILNLGAIIIMPIIITILGVVFGQKPSKALRAGITVGIGFVGISLVTGLMGNALEPVTTALSQKLDLGLSVPDVGWPVLSAIAFATSMVPIVFLLCFVLNVLMITFNLTKTMNVDIWNYWHFIYCGALVQYVTKSMVLGVIAAVISFVIINKMADWSAPKMQEFTGIPGVSFPHTDSLSWMPIGIAVNWLLDRIPGINKINIDAKKLNEKLGILGEPMMLGFILGIALGLVTGFNISESLVFGMNLAAIMFILPRMIKILMEGLVPLTDSAKEFMKKRLPGKEIYIGLDAAVAIGRPEIITTGIVLIPITLLIAAVLPGNSLLPLIDLTALPYWVIWAVIPSKGNLFRSIITATVFAVIWLLCASALAPIVTAIAASINFDSGFNGTISSLSAGSQGIPNLVYLFFRFVAKLFGFGV
ncbi:PTS galactitol transporter subunit IIC [Enterococcus faecium]|uniref:PTS galactitol transporter subunit IIC n=1 Tax=Enterococcus faecium TaxID=1352 RepID=UPI0011069EEF|nr:PTS transporter subunit IIC [Enterococcus faecium]